MNKIIQTLTRIFRAIVEAYHKLLQLTHPPPRRPEPSAPPPVQEPVIEQPPIVRRGRERRPKQPPPQPAGAPAAAPPAPATQPLPEQRSEPSLTNLETLEPAIENISELIRQHKLLAQLQEELQARKGDARAAERMARIRENMARAEEFEQRMRAYLRNNRERATQRKAKIENELLQNEAKIAELEQERKRLLDARKKEDLERLHAVEKSILELSITNDNLIGEKLALADALAENTLAKPQTPAQLADMDVAVSRNIRRLAELEAERQTLMRARDPATSERLREISEAIRLLTSENAADKTGTIPADSIPERKQRIEQKLKENAAHLANLEAERARLLNTDSARAVERLKEIENTLHNLRNDSDNLSRERDMIIRALTPMPYPPPLGEEQIMHLSAYDEHKREAQDESKRNVERHNQIITEQKARAKERAEREASIMRKRAAEIEAQREANIRANLESGRRPPMP